MKLQQNTSIEHNFIERRSNQRRTVNDRRSSFRFLMEKPNRRSGSDRRANFDIWSEQIAPKASV